MQFIYITIRVQIDIGSSMTGFNAQDLTLTKAINLN